MDITLDCKLIFSKKLRKLVQDKPVKIILTSEESQDGKAMAKLTFNTSDDLNIKNEDIQNLGETSLIIVPSKISQDISVDDFRVTNLFSSQSVDNDNSQRDVVDKIAVTDAPSQKDVPSAMIRPEEVKTPEEFKELDIPECKQWISGMSELIDAAIKAKNDKKKSLSAQENDLTLIKDERERAALQEKIQQQSGIDSPAWIVNDKIGMITINDLEIDLPINYVFNLANVSPDKLAKSQDLQNLVNKGYIKFIRPEEIETYMAKTKDQVETIDDCKVFDSPSQAEANMFKDDNVVSNPSTEVNKADERTMSSDEDTENGVEEDFEKEFEEEKMILDLTKSMANTTPSSNSNQNIDKKGQTSTYRRTHHGNKPKTSAKSAKNTEQTQNKTITRSH